MKDKLRNNWKQCKSEQNKLDNVANETTGHSLFKDLEPSFVDRSLVIVIYNHHCLRCRKTKAVNVRVF